MDMEAEEKRSENLLSIMVSIYHQKYGTPSPDDIETKIVNEHLKRDRELVEKKAAEAAGETRRKRGRESRDINMQAIKDKARSDALKDVEGEMKALKEKADKLDSMTKEVTELKAKVEELEGLLATAEELARDEKAKFVALKQAVISHDKAHTLSRDADGIWIFTPKPTGYRGSPSNVGGSLAAGSQAHWSQGGGPAADRGSPLLQIQQ